jgi:hypothetical protein
MTTGDAMNRGAFVLIVALLWGPVLVTAQLLPEQPPAPQAVARIVEPAPSAPLSMDPAAATTTDPAASPLPGARPSEPEADPAGYMEQEGGAEALERWWASYGERLRHAK